MIIYTSPRIHSAACIYFYAEANGRLKPPICRTLSPAWPLLHRTVAGAAAAAAALAKTAATQQKGHSNKSERVLCVVFFIFTMSAFNNTITANQKLRPKAFAV